MVLSAEIGTSRPHNFLAAYLVQKGNGVSGGQVLHSECATLFVLGNHKKVDEVLTKSEWERKPVY